VDPGIPDGQFRRHPAAPAGGVGLHAGHLALLDGAAVAHELGDAARSGERLRDRRRIAADLVHEETVAAQRGQGDRAGTIEARWEGPGVPSAIFDTTHGNLTYFAELTTKGTVSPPEVVRHDASGAVVRYRAAW
jgi:hypothetical protein